MENQPFQLPLFNLRDELKRYRENRGLSQQDIARRIATTQVTVSRYETGGSVSDEVEHRIRQLLIQEMSKVGGFSLSAEFEKIDRWHLGIFGFPEVSGDIAKIFSSSQGAQIPLLVGDATGSGAEAAQTASLLEVAFGATVGALGDLSVTPQTYYRAIDQSIRSSRPKWGDAPSVCVCLLERGTGWLSLLNAGMPAGLLFRGKNGAVLPVGGKLPPPGSNRTAPLVLQHESYSIEDDDVLMIFSDGFKSEIERATSYKLDVQLKAVAKALKSNVRGIAMKLLRTLESNTDPLNVRDNMCFIIIGRR